MAMVTPNGRFEPLKSICLNGMTHFHSESWSPTWQISSILVGFQSFFIEPAGGEIGAVTSSPEEKKRLAAASHAFNAKSEEFRKYFPDHVDAAYAHANAPDSKPV